MNWKNHYLHGLCINAGVSFKLANKISIIIYPYCFLAHFHAIFIATRNYLLHNNFHFIFCLCVYIFGIRGAWYVYIKYFNCSKIYWLDITNNIKMLQQRNAIEWMNYLSRDWYNNLFNSFNKISVKKKGSKVSVIWTLKVVKQKSKLELVFRYHLGN